MLKIEQDKPGKYEKLYNRLESKVDELFTYRSQLQSMEIQIEDYQNKVNEIDEVKGKVIKERDDLKASYDRLNDKIQTYKEEKETLLMDIQELKDSKATGKVIDEKKKLLHEVEIAKEETEV